MEDSSKNIYILWLNIVLINRNAFSISIYTETAHTSGRKPEIECIISTENVIFGAEIENQNKIRSISTGWNGNDTIKTLFVQTATLAI